MDIVPLSARPRTSAVKAKALRKTGVVPAIVYGNEVENTAIECDYNDLVKVFIKAGESTLVELDVAGKKVPVLFQQLDTDPVSNRITHVDFYAVNMKKEIDAQVPVTFEGESLAVKELGAIFVAVHDHVTVRCLPSNLPHSLVIDISKMKEFHDSVTVADIKLPSGVTVDEDPTTVVAIVQEPRAEEVVEVAPVEGAEGAAAEGVAPAEGAAAEGAAPAATGDKKPEAKK